MRKFIFIVLILLIVANLLFRIFSYGPRYGEDLSGEYWEERYLQSQWVVPNSQFPIGDDGLYAYHGWELVKGGDPSIINPEVPPLGKYIIGVFVQVFNNNNIFGIFSVIFALVAYFLLNKQLFNNTLLALVPVTIFSLEPLLFEQLQASFLDAFHLGLLMLTFYFFLRKNYLVAAFLLGCFAVVKFSYLLFFVIAAEIGFVILQKKYQDLKRVSISYLLLPVVILISYTAFFLHGNTLLDFGRLQKFILTFYSQGAKPPFFGMVFPMIFFKEWHTWWDAGVLTVREWTVLWPLSFLTSIFTLRYLKALIASPFLLLAVWCCGYLLFLFLTPVWPRYLLLLLPFLYNLSIWVLSQNTATRSFFARFL